MIAAEAHSVTSSASAMHPAVSMLPALPLSDYAMARPMSPRASSAEVLRPLLQITHFRVKKNKQKQKQKGAPARCCRLYCIGCPWTVAQLNRKRRK
jgi:hypothetical protein